MNLALSLIPAFQDVGYITKDTCYMNTISGSLTTATFNESVPAEMESFVLDQCKTAGTTALVQRKASIQPLAQATVFVRLCRKRSFLLMVTFQSGLTGQVIADF